MDAHKKVWVEVHENERFPELPLRSLNEQHIERCTLTPSINAYEFKKTQHEGKDWLVLVENPLFGHPEKIFRGFEIAGRVSVTDENYDAFFED